MAKTTSTKIQPVKPGAAPKRETAAEPTGTERTTRALTGGEPQRDQSASLRRRPDPCRNHNETTCMTRSVRRARRTTTSRSSSPERLADLDRRGPRVQQRPKRLCACRRAPARRTFAYRGGAETDSIVVAYLLNQLGAACKFAGLYDEAEPYYLLRAMRIAELTGGTDSDLTATLLQEHRRPRALPSRSRGRRRSQSAVAWRSASGCTGRTTRASPPTPPLSPPCWRGWASTPRPSSSTPALSRCTNPSTTTTSPG